MSLEVEGDLVRLWGRADLSEAETLCAALAERPSRRVDVSGLESAHTAVVQALLAFRPPLVGEPKDAFLRACVLPALRPLP